MNCLPVGRWLALVLTRFVFQGEAQEKPPTIWDLFQPPALLDAQLAPDGEHLGLLQTIRLPGTNQIGYGGQLGILDLKQNQLRWLPYEPECSYAWFEWANNSVLVFGIAHQERGEDFEAGGTLPSGSGRTLQRRGRSFPIFAGRRATMPGFGIARRVKE